MNSRVARLRQESLDTKPWLSIERARLLTDFYRDTRIGPPPLLRAYAFKHVMENAGEHGQHPSPRDLLPRGM